MNRTYSLSAAAALVLAAFAVPASAAMTCQSAAVPNLIRAEGLTEQVADIVITCTGGTPTPAGQVVPAVNLYLFLNTNITSHVLKPSNATVGANFGETLLLIDEPNRAGNSDTGNHKLLNCGNLGAPDNGPSGPGVCSIVSTGVPSQTYDGTPNAGPSTCFLIGTIAPIPSNMYGCGRPNVYQARTGGITPIQSNELDFLGVPLDPPGPAGVRTLRITNVRANAYMLGAGHQIMATMAFAGGGPAVSLNPPQVIVAQTLTGLKATPESGKTIRVTEGFANSWKDRNVANTLANAVYSAGKYVYNGSAFDPAQMAQNVPAVLYNTEDGFQWQNNAANAPPSPNPPQGYAGGFTFNTQSPLFSQGFGLEPTNISGAGVSNAGTRIFITVDGNPSETISVPFTVALHPQASPSTTSGIMVLTTADPAGAGPFTPATNNKVVGKGTFVYEVLYCDPFSIEFAEIQVSASSKATIKAEVGFAPFYSAPSAGFPTPTPMNPAPAAVPRFASQTEIALKL